MTDNDDSEYRIQKDIEKIDEEIGTAPFEVEKWVNDIIRRIASDYAVDPAYVRRKYDSFYEFDSDTNDVRKCKRALSDIARYYVVRYPRPKQQKQDTNIENQHAVTLSDDEKKASIEQFENPNLMHNINVKLGEGHIGNEKERLLTFVTMISSRLPPEDRVSEKVKGKTSSGKTNMVKAIARHLPDNWYITASRITVPSLEDDVKDINLILILEKPKNPYLSEALKQVSEDGMDIWKKDPNTNEQTYKGHVARKSVIDTSISAETEEEDANRAIIVHIKDDIERYQKVVNDYNEKQARLEEVVARAKDRKGHKDSWIKIGLSQLDEFDEIWILGMEAIPIEVKNASEGRIQRDVKKFNGLVKAIAWLNQKNRVQIECEGLKILVAQVEDICWAQHLSDESFYYSISNLSPKIEEILKTIDELVIAEEIVYINGEVYVSRQNIRERLNIKTENTIREMIREAEGLGIIQTYQEHRFAPVFIKRTGQLLARPLIRYESGIIFKTVGTFQELLLNLQLIPISYRFNTKINSCSITCIPDNIIDNNNTTGINNNNKCVEENDILSAINLIDTIDYTHICAHIKQKLIAESKNELPSAPRSESAINKHVRLTPKPPVASEELEWDGEKN